MLDVLVIGGSGLLSGIIVGSALAQPGDVIVADVAGNPVVFKLSIRAVYVKY